MQSNVDDFIKRYQLQSDAKTRYIDLTSEIGELGKEIIKATDYGKKNLEINDAIADEVGDCLFSMLALCNALNIDAEKALLNSLSKYEQRFANNGRIDSGN